MYPSLSEQSASLALREREQRVRTEALVARLAAARRWERRAARAAQRARLARAAVR